MTRWSICTFLLAAGLMRFLSPTEAVAACAPDSGSNVTVTCTGTTFNQGPGSNTGYGNSTQNGLALTVNSGASVTGTSTGIDVNNNNTITNLGTITTNGSMGIGDVNAINANGPLTLINSGSIGRVDIPDNISDSAGVNAMSPGLNVTNNNGALIQGQIAIQGNGVAVITNSGTISGIVGGGGEGINVNGGAVVVTNNSTGLITGDGNAITADTAVVANSGTISAPEPSTGGIAVNGNFTATVANFSGGLITGNGGGVSAQTVTVTNFGTISGTGLSGSGIFGGTVQVTNSGTISSGSDSGAAAITMTSGTITNNTGGMITGAEGIVSFGGTSIFDAGTITGTDGIAIQFSSCSTPVAPKTTGTAIVGTCAGGSKTSGPPVTIGGNTRTLAPGFTINGSVLASGSDTFQLGGSGNGAFNLSSLGVQYTGFSTFNVISGNWSASGTGIQSWGISGGNLILGSGAAIVGTVTLTGGELSGTGATGSVINTAGNVVPGNGKVGTLTVNGSYTQGSAGTLTIEISPTAASQLAINRVVPAALSAPKLIAGGGANLNGTLALLFDPGIYKLGQEFTILTAPSLNGQFSNVISSNAPPGVAPSLIYETDPAVIVQIVKGNAPTNDTIFSAATSIAVINAQQINGIILDRVGARVAGIADGEIAALAPSGLAPGGLASGAPGLQLAQAGPGNAGALGDLAASLPQLGEGAWFRGIGGFASVNGSSTAPGFTGSTGGFLGGYDRPVTPNIYLGVAGGYLHSNIDEHSTSNGTEESARFNVYGGMLAGPSLFSATAGYAHDWFSTNRGLAGIGNPSESHSGNEATVAAQWSLPMPIQGYGGGIATLTPKAGIEYLHLSEDSFAETGAAAFDLSNSGHGTDSLQPYLSAALSQKFVTASGMQITPELRLGYAHDLFDSRLLTINHRERRRLPGRGGQAVA